MQRKKAADIYIYGETPIKTLQKLLVAADLKIGERYVELGSGRGIGCLWASSHIGCVATGVEWVPRFVFFAKCIAWLTCIPVRFVKMSFFEFDCSDADVVYLYGIHLTDLEWSALLPKLESMPPGSRLIIISEPIAHPQFVPLASIAVDFPWGRTEAFVLKKQVQLAQKNPICHNLCENTGHYETKIRPSSHRTKMAKNLETKESI